MKCAVKTERGRFDMAKFKVGDKVRVLNVGAIMFGRKYLENGKVYEVISQGSSGNPRIGDRRHKDRGMRVEGLVITPDEFHAIELVKEDANMSKYRTEKRHAKVGEQILITDASSVQTGIRYGNGYAMTVTRAGSAGWPICGEYESIAHCEYEVIVGENADPTLETRVTELEAEVEALKAQLAVCEPKPQITVETSRMHFEPKTPNQRRADVIKQARASLVKYDMRGNMSGREGFRAPNGILCDAEFIVNPEKRTVVCLLRAQYGRQILSKGIAKCSPDDVFNADIGKAIALLRAKGVEVPADFLDAPKPTEVVAGMTITTFYKGGEINNYCPTVATGRTAQGYPKFANGTYSSEYAIKDDTEAQY